MTAARSSICASDVSVRRRISPAECRVGRIGIRFPARRRRNRPACRGGALAAPMNRHGMLIRRLGFVRGQGAARRTAWTWSGAASVSRSAPWSVRTASWPRCRFAVERFRSQVELHVCQMQGADPDNTLGRTRPILEDQVRHASHETPGCSGILDSRELRLRRLPPTGFRWRSARTRLLWPPTQRFARR